MPSGCIPALAKGDLPLAIARARTAAALDPHNLLAQANVSQVEAIAGHDEEVLRFDYAAKTASAAGGGDQIRPLARIAMEQLTRLRISRKRPVTIAAPSRNTTSRCDAPDFNGSRWSAVYMKSADLALAARRGRIAPCAGRLCRQRACSRARAWRSGWNQTNLDFPQFEQFAALGDWAAARKDHRTGGCRAGDRSNARNRYLGPHNALVLACAGAGKNRRFGRGAGAQIAKTPLDCYLCLRVRGQIAALQKNWNGAAYWFARAVTLAPSIPFAYTDWGAMLMAKGDLDGAIAKFEIAHQKARTSPIRWRCGARR